MIWGFVALSVSLDPRPQRFAEGLRKCSVLHLTSWGSAGPYTQDRENLAISVRMLIALCSLRGHSATIPIMLWPPHAQASRFAV